MDVYGRYTSTSVLQEEEEATLTAWSIGYFRRKIPPHLPSNKDAAILDVGCGYGRYVKALADSQYTNVVGVDLSVEQVAFATAKLGLDNVFQADALAFLDGKECVYDAVLLMDVLEHLELHQSLKLTSLVWTSLKRGGVLVVQVPNALAPLGPYRYYDITHQRAYTRHSIVQTLLLGGFRPADITCLDVAPYVHNAWSFARWVAWTLALRPMVAAFAGLAYGTGTGGIYTANMLAIARKESVPWTGQRSQPYCHVNALEQNRRA